MAFITSTEMFKKSLKCCETGTSSDYTTSFGRCKKVCQARISVKVSRSCDDGYGS